MSIYLKYVYTYKNIGGKSTSISCKDSGVFRESMGLSQLWRKCQLITNLEIIVFNQNGQEVYFPYYAHIQKFTSKKTIYNIQN